MAESSPASVDYEGSPGDHEMAFIRTEWERLAHHAELTAARFTEMDKRLAAYDTRFDAVDRRFDQLTTILLRMENNQLPEKAQGKAVASAICDISSRSLGIQLTVLQGTDLNPSSWKETPPHPLNAKRTNNLIMELEKTQNGRVLECPSEFLEILVSIWDQKGSGKMLFERAEHQSGLQERPTTPAPDETKTARPLAPG
ncbi:hypothetical protein F2Q70_00043429 [Brassica cretica]|uniref:Uncharacterized protein n=1 Tax=Brassica cretica TaxID=69181 RepID=A0A8S9KJL1_BRACR|nr:hypothetical protein F2Q70_00043429 [Brassica cretica]